MAPTCQCRVGPIPPCMACVWSSDCVLECGLLYWLERQAACIGPCIGNTTLFALGLGLEIPAFCIGPCFGRMHACVGPSIGKTMLLGLPGCPDPSVMASVLLAIDVLCPLLHSWRTEACVARLRGDQGTSASSQERGFQGMGGCGEGSAAAA